MKGKITFSVSWKFNAESPPVEEIGYVYCIYYVHSDHLGSPALITDNTGNEVVRYSFDPWGRQRNPYDWNDYSATDELLYARGFTGHEHLTEFALIHMNGRVYDPVLGRMLSPDNFVQAVFNAQNYNRYTYALNNPLIFTDPTGYWFGWDDAVVAGVGFVYGYLSHGIKTGDWGNQALINGAIMAGTAWMGYNTLGVSMTATEYVGNMAIQTIAGQVLPSITVPLSENFSVSGSPFFMLGSHGIALGFLLRMNLHMDFGEGYYADVGIGLGLVGSTIATGTNAKNTFGTRLGYGVTMGRND